MRCLNVIKSKSLYSGRKFQSSNDCIYIHFTSSSNVLVLILHVRRSAEIYPYTIVDCRFSTIVLFYGFGNILQTVPADEVPRG
jgi:hypothetical protein